MKTDDFVTNQLLRRLARIDTVTIQELWLIAFDDEQLEPVIRVFARTRFRWSLSPIKARTTQARRAMVRLRTPRPANDPVQQLLMEFHRLQAAA